MSYRRKEYGVKGTQGPEFIVCFQALCFTSMCLSFLKQYKMGMHEDHKITFEKRLSKLQIALETLAGVLLCKI